MRRGSLAVEVAERLSCGGGEVEEALILVKGRFGGTECRRRLFILVYG